MVNKFDLSEKIVEEDIDSVDIGEYEFDLSEKIRYGYCSSKGKTAMNQVKMIKGKDIKEFVRLLKEMSCWNHGDMKRKIDKLAGDELNGKRK